MPNAIVSSTFTKTVLVTNYFYRVRCEAALALVTVCTVIVPETLFAYPSLVRLSTT